MDFVKFAWQLRLLPLALNSIKFSEINQTSTTLLYSYRYTTELKTNKILYENAILLMLSTLTTGKQKTDHICTQITKIISVFTLNGRASFRSPNPFTKLYLKIYVFSNFF